MATRATPHQIRVVGRDDLRREIASGGMTRLAGVSADTVGSENIFMGVSRLPPGARSTGHVHLNCESALYVTSGRGRFLIGPHLDRALAIDAGDFIHVPPGAPHAVVNDGDQDLVILVARNTQVEQVEPYEVPLGEREEATATPFDRPLLLNRCKTCRVPIRGLFSVVSRVRGIVPYSKNPQLCNRCEASVRGSEDCVVTVLFADIRSYTGLTRESSNEALLAMLRRFFNQAAPAVYDDYGVVDQFLGDGMKVLFNVPVRRTTHHHDALHAAVAVQQRCRNAPFGVGIGLETGMALAGHIGLDTVADFTCVGEAVNAAARLQALARAGEIVIGPTLWRKISAEVEELQLPVAVESCDLKGIGVMEIHRATLPS